MIGFSGFGFPLFYFLETVLKLEFIFFFFFWRISTINYLASFGAGKSLNFLSCSFKYLLVSLISKNLIVIILAFKNYLSHTYFISVFKYIHLEFFLSLIPSFLLSFLFSWGIHAVSLFFFLISITRDLNFLLGNKQNVIYI